MWERVITAVLSLGLLITPVKDGSTFRDAKSLTAVVKVATEEQKAVWEKYEVVQETRFSDPEYSNSKDFFLIILLDPNSTFSTYSSYTYSSERGFEGTGVVRTYRYLENEPVQGYYISSESVHSLTKHSVIKGPEYWSCALYYNGVYTCKKSTAEVPGVKISDVVANRGSFPQNGKHTDGYWYTLKNLVED